MGRPKSDAVEREYFVIAKQYHALAESFSALAYALRLARGGNATIGRVDSDDAVDVKKEDRTAQPSWPF